MSDYNKSSFVTQVYCSFIFEVYNSNRVIILHLNYICYLVEKRGLINIQHVLNVTYSTISHSVAKLHLQDAKIVFIHVENCVFTTISTVMSHMYCKSWSQQSRL